MVKSKPKGTKERKTQKESKPPPSSLEASRRMKATRGTDNRMDLQIRSLLHRRGYRFFKQRRILKGSTRTADIVFPKARVAVFVDGCFWHGCREHGTWPKANADFWRDKIETNRLRDADTTKRLEEEGWEVLRIWEHEDPDEAVKEIIDILDRRGG